MSGKDKKDKREVLPPKFEGNALFPFVAPVLMTAVSVVVAELLIKFKVEELVKAQVTKYIQPKSEFALLLAGLFLFSKVIMWMGMHCVRARSLYNVPWPHLYATADVSPDYHVYNCTQRAHQQTLEIWAIFILTSYISFLLAPYITSVSVFLFAISRIGFASGYRTGHPGKRARGAWGMIPQLAIDGLALVYVVSQLGVPMPWRQYF